MLASNRPAEAPIGAPPLHRPKSPGRIRPGQVIGRRIFHVPRQGRPGKSAANGEIRPLPHRAVIPAIRILVLVLLAGVVACGDGRPPDSGEDVGAPPSVRGGSGRGSLPTRIRLTPEQARTLAVRTVTVAREPVGFRVQLPGTVHPAPGYYGEVSSPLSGRIASMAVAEGESVAEGQVVAELESLELADLAADFLEARAELRYAASQVSRYETLVARRISPEAVLEKARADLSRARARNTATHARLHSLGVSDRDLERWYGEDPHAPPSGAVAAGEGGAEESGGQEAAPGLPARLPGSEADTGAAAPAVAAGPSLAVSAGDIQRPLLPLRSPIDGVVAEHSIELGQSVTAYQKMMTVVNPERVLVRGFLSPDDAAFVRPGDSVRVSLERAPGRELDAVVTTVSPSLAEGSRSVTVNVLLETGGTGPIPGQSVRLGIRVRPAEPLVTLPLSAVEYEGEDAVVFVRGADERTWLRRVVELARITDEEVIVASGLEPGEEVATSQVFTLKAMARFERFGEGE